MGLLLDMWYAWRAERIDSFINTMSLSCSRLLLLLSSSLSSDRLRLSSDLTRTLGWPQAGDWRELTIERQYTVTERSPPWLVTHRQRIHQHLPQVSIVCGQLSSGHGQQSSSVTVSSAMMIGHRMQDGVTSILLCPHGPQAPAQMSGAGQLPGSLVRSAWRHSAPHLCGHELSNKTKL